MQMFVKLQDLRQITVDGMANDSLGHFASGADELSW